MSTSRMSRAAIGTVALLVAVSVSACEEEEPSTSPPPSSSPSVPKSSSPNAPPTTPSGPVEPTLPTQAEADTRRGAEAFATFYWEVVNYSQINGDTELLANLSVDACDGCNGGIEAIDRIYQRGGRIIGGRNTVVSTDLVRKPSGGWSAAQVVRVSRQRIRGTGDLDRVASAGRLDVLLGLTYQDGQWVVTSLGV